MTDTVYPKKYAHGFFALLCFVVVIHWLIFPYPSGLLHWHCGNLTIAPVPAKQPWRIWINTSSEFIMHDCITTTKQSTTKPCAYFLGYTVSKNTCPMECHSSNSEGYIPPCHIGGFIAHYGHFVAMADSWIHRENSFLPLCLNKWLPKTLRTRADASVNWVIIDSGNGIVHFVEVSMC